jgi:Na+/H+ antiporter NhaD/arsenite permease-like protein
LEEVMKHEPMGVDGGLNFLFLAGVVAIIVVSGQKDLHLPPGVQEGVMVVLAIAAYFTTPAANREKNKFSFGPINEVAILFIGIFVTMTPALLILNAWGEPGTAGRKILGFGFFAQEPWQYFWGSGILSSFLDNAPTYLAFASPACGKFSVPVSDEPYLAELLTKGPEAVRILEAISCGAVFMGANTYIGNGPNFMVKAIAEENGVKMPSFFGYMVYSGLILIPIFIAVTFVFFR